MKLPNGKWGGRIKLDEHGIEPSAGDEIELTSKDGRVKTRHVRYADRLDARTFAVGLEPLDRPAHELYSLTRDWKSTTNRWKADMLRNRFKHSNKKP